MSDRRDERDWRDWAAESTPADRGGAGGHHGGYDQERFAAESFSLNPFPPPETDADASIVFDPLDPLGLNRLGRLDQFDEADPLEMPPPVDPFPRPERLDTDTDRFPRPADPFDRPGQRSPLASLDPLPPLGSEPQSAQQSSSAPDVVPRGGLASPGSGPADADRRFGAREPSAGRGGEPLEGLVIDRATGRPVEIPARGEVQPRLTDEFLPEDSVAATDTDRVLDVDLREPPDDLPRWDPLSDDLPEELAAGLAASPADGLAFDPFPAEPPRETSRVPVASPASDVAEPAAPAVGSVPPGGLLADSTPADDLGGDDLPADDVAADNVPADNVPAGSRVEDRVNDKVAEPADIPEPAGVPEPAAVFERVEAAWAVEPARSEVGHDVHAQEAVDAGDAADEGGMGDEGAGTSLDDGTAPAADGSGPADPAGPAHPDYPTDRPFMAYSGFSGGRRHVGFQIGSLPEPAIPDRGVPNLVSPEPAAADEPASAVPASAAPLDPARDEPAPASPLVGGYPTAHAGEGAPAATEPVIAEPPLADPAILEQVAAEPAAARAVPAASSTSEPPADAQPDVPDQAYPADQSDATDRPPAYLEPAPNGKPGPSVVPSGRQVRAAVYNRFWHSMGGGERHNGMIAQVMAADGAEVDILGHSDVDLGLLGAHLGLDLSGCRYVRIPDRGEEDLSVLSGDYDLFVNGSYMSRVPTRSRKAAYLCFFPTPFDHDMAAWRKAAVRSAGPLLRGVRPAVDFGIGWYPPEGGRLRQWRWSSGSGVLSISAGGRRSLRAEFGRPGAPTGTPLRVVGPRGETLAKIDVGAEFVLHDIPLPESELGTEITLVSEPFTPGPADVRELGIAISKPRVVDAQEGLPAKVALRFPWLLRDPHDLAWLDRYDVVMANSDYTRGWIRRMWRTEADVLYPPIQVDRLHSALVREKTIVTVGRFFAPGLGHAKRQLEMVQWFGELYNAGALPGWTMHVVGGMEDSQKNYVEQVREAGAGLPVEVHPNAPRSDVEKLLSTASMFWSATGWGEDERRKPWTAEHFGMTTVEAMAAGAVPVVIDRAGQREIVRHSIDGYRWTDPEQLMSFTRRLAAEDDLRSRLAAEAVRRAQLFSDAAFAERWRTIASRHHLYEG